MSPPGTASPAKMNGDTDDDDDDADDGGTATAAVAAAGVRVAADIPGIIDRKEDAAELAAAARCGAGGAAGC